MVSFVAVYRKSMKDAGFLCCQMVFEVWLNFSFDKMAAVRSDDYVRQLVPSLLKNVCLITGK
jgi:hypothetical protein